MPAGYGRWREYRYDPSAVVIPAPAWLEGGSLSGWRSGGITSSGYNAQGGVGGAGGGGAGGVGAFGPAGGYGGGGGGQGDGDRPERKRGFVKDLSTVLCFVSLPRPVSTRDGSRLARSLVHSDHGKCPRSSISALTDLDTDEQKCNQHGHFANACPNQAVPGDRGGLKRQF